MELDLLLDLNREQGATLVLVKHEAAVAQCAERRVLLHDGRIVDE
jgi:putative ABC transport system ATP-binding protein